MQKAVWFLTIWIKAWSGCTNSKGVRGLLFLFFLSFYLKHGPRLVCELMTGVRPERYIASREQTDFFFLLLILSACLHDPFVSWVTPTESESWVNLVGSNVESREQHVYTYRHITYPEQLQESASMTLVGNFVFSCRQQQWWNVKGRLCKWLSRLVWSRLCSKMQRFK